MPILLINNVVSLYLPCITRHCKHVVEIRQVLQQVCRKVLPIYISWRFRRSVIYTDTRSTSAFGVIAGRNYLGRFGHATHIIEVLCILYTVETHLSALSYTYTAHEHTRTIHARYIIILYNIVYLHNPTNAAFCSNYIIYIYT